MSRSALRAAVVGIGVWLGGCAGAAPVPGLISGAGLQHFVDSAAATTSAPGLMLRVEAPNLGVIWTGAAGHFDRATKEPLRADHGVRIASNTKTFVAAAVLRLVEKGSVGLDSTVGRYLAPETIRTLRRGGYDPAAITVRHLLNHTGGLFDYAMSPQFMAAVFRAPKHRWTRPEQVAFAVDSGKPIGPPGRQFHYTDTGYILLGEIIERTTGMTMGRAVHELVGFDRLRIRHTYFETLDSVPPGAPPMAHQYADSTDLNAFDPSLDLYGGGGLVSTLEDLATFYRALVRGEVFEQRETLDLMLAVTPESQTDRPGGYGMGIGASTIGTAVCYGHSGFWGTIARYCPGLDLTVVGAVNQMSESGGTLGKAVNAIIERAVVESPR